MAGSVTEVDSLQKILSIITGPGGTFAMFIIFVVGLQKKWFVIGWVYESCLADAQLLRTSLDTRVSSAEADLREYRKSKGLPGNG